MNVLATRMSAIVGAVLMDGCGGPAGPSHSDDVEPDTRNPSGEFANTLIRGRPPGSAFAGNTVAAIQEAAAGGYRYVEIDVRVTADGHLLPCRDDDLAAFSTCRGRVSGSTVMDLAECSTIEGEPTRLEPLDGALADASFSGIYLDLKSTETEPVSSAEQIRDAVVALRSLLAEPTSVVAMSYRQDAADALVAAGVRTARKGYPDDPNATLALLDGAAAGGAEMICVNVATIDDGVAARAVEEDVWLLPWAQAAQVDRALIGDLRRWGAGGLISGAFEVVEDLLAGP